jgi:hypothetical protein
MNYNKKEDFHARGEQWTDESSLAKFTRLRSSLSIFFPLDDFVQRCREMKSASADELLRRRKKAAQMRKKAICCVAAALRAERAAPVCIKVWRAGRAARCARTGRKSRKKPTATHAAMMTSFPKQHTPKLIFAKATDALQMDEFFWPGP